MELWRIIDALKFARGHLAERSYDRSLPGIERDASYEAARIISWIIENPPLDDKEMEHYKTMSERVRIVAEENEELQAMLRVAENKYQLHLQTIKKLQEELGGPDNVVPLSRGANE